MRRGETGQYHVTTTGGESVRAFAPSPLPPVPPLVMSDGLQPLLEAAVLAVGRLDGVSTLLPDRVAVPLRIRAQGSGACHRRSKARSRRSRTCCSSNSTKRPGVPLDDVVEVSNYVAALDHGLARLREGFPLSNRLIREIHGVLLSRGRGSGKDPGEFRRSQNWIGGARPGNADFRAASARCGAGVHGGARAVPAREPTMVCHVLLQGRARARPVRNHSPLSRRQRPSRASADHLAACVTPVSCASRCSISASTSSSTAPRYYELLRPRASGRRLGGVARRSSYEGVKEVSGRCGRYRGAARGRSSVPTAQRIEDIGQSRRLCACAYTRRSRPARSSRCPVLCRSHRALVPGGVMRRRTSAGGARCWRVSSPANGATGCSSTIATSRFLTRELSARSSVQRRAVGDNLCEDRGFAVAARARRGVDCSLNASGDFDGEPHSYDEEQARALLENLPDDVTWDDIVYELAARLSS